MLLLDFNQIMLANLHAQVGIHNDTEIQPDLLRHMILNTVRSIRTKYKKDYGELVIACENRSWRRDVFPYYKANRDKAKEKNEKGFDWKLVFETFNSVREDLKNFFPYPVVGVERAEADDVIGTLVNEHGNDGPMNIGEPILLVSGDHDFAQLHKYSNVRQFDPVHKKWITVPNPRDFLLEHIIKGDAGDGVPNIISDDDTFVVEGKRQKPMTAKRLAEYKEKYSKPFDTTVRDLPTFETNKKFLRNQQLIDLSFTPETIRTAVLNEYEAQQGKDRSHIFNYFVTHRLRGLMDAINDF